MCSLFMLLVIATISDMALLIRRLKFHLIPRTKRHETKNPETETNQQLKDGERTQLCANQHRANVEKELTVFPNDYFTFHS